MHDTGVSPFSERKVKGQGHTGQLNFESMLYVHMTVAGAVRYYADGD